MSAQPSVDPNIPNEHKTRLALVASPKTRRHELPVGIGLASLSGVLWFLACPDFDIWPLALVAMVPGLFAIERAPSTRRAILYGWLIGLVGNAGGFYWIIGLLERFAGLSLMLSVPLFIIICGIQALRLLVFAWMLRVIRRNFNHLPVALLAPLIMVTAELCIPLVFQYYLGFTLARQLHFIQIADLTGPLGATALLVMVSGAIYDIATNRARARAVAFTSVLVLVAVLAYGHFRINQMSELRAAAPKIKVGIVQPNTAPASTGSGKGIFAYQQVSVLQAKSAELEAEGADLIVWPESAYPRTISREAEGDWPEQHPSRIRRGFTAPLILNAETSSGISTDRPYNSALMLDAGGKFTARYDKNYLLMFGEYFPGVETFPSLLRFAPAASDQYASGREVIALPFQTRDGRQWRIGPMICLEDILPSFGRRLGELRPHLLVNLTNDSWFGDTSEPWQHLSLSVFRSIELRTELVRAVQTGVSAYVDATGRIYAETYSTNLSEKPRPADKLLEEVALIEGGHTVYAAIGDVFGYICTSLTLFLWLALPRMRSRSPRMS